MTEVQTRGGSQNDAGEVVEYLQLVGRRYREHVELLRQEQEVREAQRAPFKPTITAYAEQASKTSVVRQGSSIGNRLHELHQKRIALLAEEAAGNAARRESEAQEVCTFAPAVTAKAEHSTRRDGDVSVSLTRWEEQRRARQVRRQVEAARSELSTVTGVPRISAYAVEKAQAERHRRSVPIQASLMAEAEARRRRQYTAFEQSYTTASTTSMRNDGSSGSINGDGRSSPRFAPVISPYAANIQYERGVVDRLYTRHRAQQQQNQKGGASGVYDEEVELHCTFQPQLSPQSTALSTLYYAESGEVGADPHERLYRNAQHASKYRKSVLPDERGDGRPGINDRSRHLVEERRRQLAADGNPGALGHSPGSRLYPGSTTNPTASPSPPRPTFKKKVVTARDIELQTALTFAPSVSAASDALWRQRVRALKATGVARTEDEARQLLWRKAEKKREEEIAKLQGQRRREEAAACTFHPTAGRPPHRRSGYIAMPIEARTTLWAKQREARLAELRDELEGSTLEECSFQPHVDPVFPLPRPEAKLATGVETFVERQAAARRLREAAKEWWRPKYARTPGLASANTSNNLLRPRINVGPNASTTPRSAASGETSLKGNASIADRTGSPLQRIATSTSADGHHDDEPEEDDDEVFVQHWARRPPSTSLTASSFSHPSQPEVPSAESSPRQLAFVVRQPAAVSSREERDAAAGPYRWQRSSPDERAGRTTTTPPAWRKPLRYRAR